MHVHVHGASHCCLSCAPDLLGCLAGYGLPHAVHGSVAAHVGDVIAAVAVHHGCQLGVVHVWGHLHFLSHHTVTLSVVPAASCKHLWDACVHAMRAWACKSHQTKCSTCTSLAL